MKRALSLVLIALPVLPFIACSSESPVEVPNNGGTATTPQAGTGTTGGTSPSAGTAAQTGGTSGSTSTAGTSPGAGTSSTGGTGTGGVATAGTSAGGMSGSATGGTGGSAGSTTGGTGGAPAAAVSVGELDGMLIQTPCKTSGTDDCDSAGWIYKGVTHACNGPLDTDHSSTKTILDFPVTGEKGKVYIATMRFYGVMEPKVYGDNIQREIMGSARPGQSNPSTPAPFAWGKTPGATYTGSDYNTYEVHVIDDTGKVVKDYYINADTQHGHWTYAIDYERPIEIIGGGKVHVRSYDNNCRMIKNCGTSGAGMPCSGKAQTVAGVSAAMPAITVTQPGLGQPAGDSGQWFAIDVKSIVPK